MKGRDDEMKSADTMDEESTAYGQLFGEMRETESTVVQCRARCSAGPMAG